MSQQPWTQIHPNPGLDPGFRWDIDGRARFQHKGFTVDVLIRRAREDEPAYFRDVRPSSDDVVLVGTITLDGVELSRVEQGADITEPHQMREALTYVLDSAVKGARTQVLRLLDRIGDISAKQDK